MMPTSNRTAVLKWQTAVPEGAIAPIVHGRSRELLEAGYASAAPLMAAAGVMPRPGSEPMYLSSPNE